MIDTVKKKKKERKPYYVTMNKVSGGDGIPVKLFKILKDDAVNVLHSLCQVQYGLPFWLSW